MSKQNAHPDYRFVQNKSAKNYFPSFLDGARKEAKEPLAKFNARDESRSLMPVDGKKRHQKSRHSSLSHPRNPPKFRTLALFFIS
jgi:hypothetical protein